MISRTYSNNLEWKFPVFSVIELTSRFFPTDLKQEIHVKNKNPETEKGIVDSNKIGADPPTSPGHSPPFKSKIARKTRNFTLALRCIGMRGHKSGENSDCSSNKENKD